MILSWLKERLSPESAKQIFLFAQIGLGALIVLGVFILRPRQSDSRFKVREGDLKTPPKTGPGSGHGSEDALAQARIARAQPLSLTGIRIDGAPHEVLGVSPTAGPDEIQTAYRELMKQYHPDKIAPPGSRQWKDAQRIAEAINLARDRMLQKNPKRSGR